MVRATRRAISLIISNDFSDGTTQSWAAYGGGVLSVVNGRLNIHASGRYHGAVRYFNVIAGRQYRVRFDVDRGNAVAYVSIWNNGARPVWSYFSGNGISSYNFTATGPNAEVRIETDDYTNAGDYTYSIDNFIVEEIKPLNEKEPTPQGDCITMTQPKWVPTLVDSCYYSNSWPWWKYNLKKLTGGVGTVSKATVVNNEVMLTVASDESLNFSLKTVANLQQTIEWEVGSYNSGGSIQFIEMREGVEVSLGSSNIKGSGINRVSILPSMTDVEVRLIGPMQLGLRRICVKRPGLKQENVLVTICPDDKDKYRFGFNGQEKVNEWSGIGNHNTAEFWEYDTRTARRLNLDPKPHPSWSFYSTFSGNPILYGDPNGDTAVVQTKGNTQEWRHVDGKWIDSKTRKEVSLSDVKDKSAAAIMGGYSELGKDPSMSGLLDFINNDSHNVILFPGKTTETNAESFLKKYSPNIYVMINAKGTTFEKGYNENNKSFKAPLYVTVAHELGHVEDLLKHPDDFSLFTNRRTPFPYGGTQVEVSKTEVNAMYWENVARVHGNLPLRIKYEVDTKAAYFMGPGQLPSIKKEFKNGAQIGITLEGLNDNKIFIPNKTP